MHEKNLVMRDFSLKQIIVTHLARRKVGDKVIDDLHVKISDLQFVTTPEEAEVGFYGMDRSFEARAVRCWCVHHSGPLRPLAFRSSPRVTRLYGLF